jgi:hypothetical protein
MPHASRKRRTIHPVIERNDQRDASAAVGAVRQASPQQERLDAYPGEASERRVRCDWGGGERDRRVRAREPGCRKPPRSRGSVTKPSDETRERCHERQLRSIERNDM